MKFLYVVLTVIEAFVTGMAVAAHRVELAIFAAVVTVYCVVGAIVVEGT